MAVLGLQVHLVIVSSCMQLRTSGFDVRKMDRPVEAIPVFTSKLRLRDTLSLAMVRQIMDT